MSGQHQQIAPERSVANGASLHFLPQAHPPLRQQWWAVAGLLLVLLITHFSAFRHLSTRYLGGFDRDAGLYVWLMKVNMRGMFGIPWFNTPAFYPYTRTLAWSDNFILPSFVAWPLVAVGASTELAYNIILLGACFLNGFVTYRLSYQLSTRPFPSWTAGVAFMASSCLTAQLGHPQLQFAFWLPLALSYLIAYLAHPSLRAAIQIGLTVVCTYLCSVYYAVLIPPLIAVVLLAFFVVRPGHLSPRGYLLLMAGCILGAAPLAFVVQPYLDVRHTFGGRGLYEAFAFSATGLSYLAAPPLNLLYGRLAFLSHPEARLFPGLVAVFLMAAAFQLLQEQRLRTVSRSFLVAMLLTAAFSSLSATELTSLYPWLARHQQLLRYLCGGASWVSFGCALLFLYRLGALERRLDFTPMSNRGLIAVFLFTAYVFFALSLGPLGIPSAGHFASGLFAVFYVLVPGADGLRAVSRLGILAILCITVTLPFALAAIARARGWGLRFYALVTCCVVIENLHTAIPVEGAPETPQVFALAERLPSSGISPDSRSLSRPSVSESRDALLVLPMARQLTSNGKVASWSDFAYLNVRYMQWGLSTGMQLVNGYSGQRSKLMQEYPRSTAHFPDTRSLKALSLIAGLRYIIYMPSYDPAFDPADFERRLQEFSASFVERGRDSQGNYLLEFRPLTLLGQGAFFKMPSYPAGRALLHLMSPLQQDTPNVTLDLFVTQLSEKTPFRTLSLVADGEWHSYELGLPAIGDHVRPLFLSFRPSGNAKVYMGSLL